MRDRARVASRVPAGVSLAALLICVTSLCRAGSARADEAPYNPFDTYGEIGILDMPSARMAPDGQLSGTVGLLSTTQRYNFSFQFLPWLEGSFRYSRIADIRGEKALFDRSFSTKIRFFRETEYTPEFSMGIRDILGTGVYGAEYFAASKRFEDFDFTAGVGWGRLASVDTFPNPFGLISPSFKTRPEFTGGTGGTVNFGEFFHGPFMGLFGGAIWHSPIDNLDVLAEYSSDKYVEEVAGGAFKVRMPVNAGLSYKFFDIATVSAGWYYGTSYGVTLSLSADPTVPVSAQRIGPDIPPPTIRPYQQQVNALDGLLQRNRPSDHLALGAPFVQLPTTPPDPDTIAVAAALMSVEGGVDDVDISGRTLMVDAHFLRSPGQQCQRYARDVETIAPRVRTIAISDSNDRSGKVEICAVARRAAFTADDDTGGAASDAPPPADPAAIEKKIRDDIAAQSLTVEALAVEPQMVWVYFSNRHYYSEAEAAGRIARVLMADAPPGAEIFHIISVRQGVNLLDFQIARSALERATLAFGTATELNGAVSIATPPLDNPIYDRAAADSYPRFHWNFGPSLAEGFFDPQRPLQVQLYAAANASVDVTRNLTFEARVEANIWNNIDLTAVSNSLLPHVRSDLVEYFKHGINGIAHLDAVYRSRLDRDVYFEAKAGYLEDMFAGGGAQVLWRPQNERFAVGADLYEVWQRDFDRLFGVQNYHILTGHISVYYQSPWYGLDFNIHAGRYLAGDYGATIEVLRQFDTGVQIGAFATFTNVPFSTFGEGAFDKGIIVHIPLEWALPFYSTSSYDLLLRSLTRDGGQRLFDDDSLYDETRPNSYAEAQDHLDDVVAP